MIENRHINYTQMAGTLAQLGSSFPVWPEDEKLASEGKFKIGYIPNIPRDNRMKDLYKSHEMVITLYRVHSLESVECFEDRLRS